jgi:putative transposase
MANTYSQINVHAVFAVRGRENLLREDFRGSLYSYINGIIKGIGLFPLAVNGYSDHVHILFELNPSMSVSKAMQEIKANSSKWINDQKFFKKKFHWQNGYGAFSYSRSQRDRVIKYIHNQKRHHERNSFRNEYLKMLENSEVQYDSKYIFEFYD